MRTRSTREQTRGRIPLAASLIGVLAAMVVTSAPVAAGTGGRPTGHAHPAVGALVVAQPPRFGPVAWCSGVLITPTAFLTAAHCTAVLTEPGAALIGVTFDPSFAPRTSTVIPGTVHVNPAYDPAAPDAATHDLAVVVLAEAADGIEPVALPEDDLDLTKLALTDRTSQGFTAVGYGVTGFLTATAGGVWAFDLQDYGIRRAAPLAFSALRDDLLLLTATTFPPPLANSGTPCFGDSGGPVFLGEGATVAALHTATTLACAEPFAFTRLDTPAARTFLDPFLESGASVVAPDDSARPRL